MSKKGLVLFLLYVLIVFVGFSIHGSIREQEAYNQLEAENQEVKESIRRIYEESFSVRISIELGMREVTLMKWREDLQPAIQDAVALCAEK